jgi:hypothetical protein
VRITCQSDGWSVVASRLWRSTAYEALLCPIGWPLAESTRSSVTWAALPSVAVTLTSRLAVTGTLLRMALFRSFTRQRLRG